MSPIYNKVSELKKDLFADKNFSDKDFSDKNFSGKKVSGKKVVFTNGCFDILHSGHIFILREAARQGDILIVGLNDDSSVKLIKGENRPVIDENSRAEILNALEMVDYVILFSEPTPENIIEAIKPDVLVKGGEYGEGEIVGENIAAETVRIKMKLGYSTTSIIEKMKREDK
ncbi:MAG: adenylyltransferase/cytidyltransferase family protein [Elusimicrobia bacterium]|jgi:D-beta-D-heptose 7-phosphate kinase/D-beta-D-heptose 1-phosphate adenosyltransferase|nr:adenylyltransferase/cytidyltransferase family protein [Elusimicrobiota bacterium]